uniref:NACHT, LRR and PYD domains-containing protein 12-like n=1 Tax=Pogona vitticeps TaxID=103695 RepID=A0ABM5F3P2_9SAUR
MEGNIQEFGRCLDSFTEGQLRKLTEHFKQDLIYVIENDINGVVSDLKRENVITSQQAQAYKELETRQDSTKAAEKLVADFFSKSKVMAMELWKCLFSLMSQCPHPNLEGMMDEITCNGQTLLDEILINETGHTLDPEMKVVQDELKSILFEQTRRLQENREGAGPHGQSFPIVSRYVELKVISEAQFRRQRLQEHETLAAAGELNEYRLRQKTQAKLERITLDRLFRWCFRLKQTARSVMVSGVAGVGKTTLVQKFLFDWATNKHYQKFSFVFFFKFRDLNMVRSGTSLESLILQSYPDLEVQLGAILQDPDRLLFIFDGLDESNGDLHLKSPEFCTWPKDVKPVPVIVASLLKEKLLKGCSVILTSRPSKLANLEAGVFHRVVGIVGFLSQERERYFLNYFEEEAVARNALAHVRDSQVLYTLCYNPSYCWITCTALQPYFTANAERGHPLPRTVTQLFVSYVKHMLVNHTREPLRQTDVRERLTRLGWLADYGLNHHILIFEENSLEGFHVPESPLRTAFLVENLKLHKPLEVTYSFVHLTVQEFFAALVPFLEFDEDNFEETKAGARSNRSGEFDIFLRFLSGLSDPATRGPLEAILGEFSKPAPGKVIDYLSSIDCTALLSSTEHGGKRKALNYLSWLFEAQNEPLVLQMLGGHVCMTFSELILTPVDCAILGYILSCCNQMERLDLDSCYIQTEGLQKLGPHLHKIRELSLCNNYLQDSAIEHLAAALKHRDCRLETLSLAKNGLTEKCCEGLKQACLANRTLLRLNLTRNKLQNKGISILLGVFSNPNCAIEELSFQENALSDDACPTLFLALFGNQTLRRLNLSGNNFTDACFEEMCNLIPVCRGLEEIRLNLCDFTPEVEKKLKTLEESREGLKIFI